MVMTGTVSSCMKLKLGAMLAITVMSTCETQVAQRHTFSGRSVAYGDLEVVADDSIEWYDDLLKTTPKLVQSIARERSNRASMGGYPVAKIKSLTHDGREVTAAKPIRKHSYVGDVAADGVITISDSLVEPKPEVSPSLVRSAVADGASVISDSLIGGTSQRAPSHVRNTKDRQRIKANANIGSESSADDKLDANATISMSDDEPIRKHSYVGNIAADGVTTISDELDEPKHEVSPSLVRSAVADSGIIMSDSLIDSTSQRSPNHVRNIKDRQRMKYVASKGSESSAEDTLDTNVTVSMLHDEAVQLTFMANLGFWARPRSKKLAMVAFGFLVSSVACACFLFTCVFFNEDNGDNDGHESHREFHNPQCHTRPHGDEG